jgi:uncharacterized membrane protein
MMFKTPVLFSVIAVMGLTACVDPNAYPDDPNARAKNGAIMGGLIGAVAGASQGGDNRLGKAVVGGALGAALGGVIGASLDQQAADLRGSIGNQNKTFCSPPTAQPCAAILPAISRPLPPT